MTFQVAMRPTFILPLALAAATAEAAIAPHYPRDDVDRCEVVKNAVPEIRNVGSLPYGMVGQVPRIYVVPPIVDCRYERPRQGYWMCEPTWQQWARRSCKGLEIK